MYSVVSILQENVAAVYALMLQIHSLSGGTLFAVAAAMSVRNSDVNVVLRPMTYGR